jgi:DNA polymerase (family X)
MPKKRRVIKKGRLVITRNGPFVLKLANRIFSDLKPYCRRIEFVGSIRRGEKNPVDIDIAVIPRDKDKIEEVLRKKGKLVRHGEKLISYLVEGVKIEIYITSVDSWGAALLTYIGPSGHSIGLRIYAKKRGLKLNQYGLFRGTKKIAGKTEKEIYRALGKKYKRPEFRGE